mgnify:CR=1 FL=1|jgi:hypothetical protein
MKWLLNIKCASDDWTFARAAKNGKLENLKWLYENNFLFDSYTLSYAAKKWKFGEYKMVN